MAAPMSWDVFCRVIDNLGDIGVCWRLSRDLASRGHTVRLWVDDPSALAWMAPGGHPSIDVVHWAEPLPDAAPGDVVVETFGCDPPPAFVRRMAARAPPPAWINLEHLSAEAYAQRSHRLPSPQAAASAGAGLVKWFYFPGFVAASGGLIRETGLLQRERGFDRADWLASHGMMLRDGERVVSLYCYDNPALPALLEALSVQPTLLLVTPGITSRLVQRLALPQRLRTVMLPWLSQTGFDDLLWCCDLNIVRGEDSFVRAQWVGRPFLWQAYPQADRAHQAKVDAYAGLLLQHADASVARDLRRLFASWNGFGAADIALPDDRAWQALCRAWRDRLLAQDDLTTQLVRFAIESR